MSSRTTSRTLTSYLHSCNGIQNILTSVIIDSAAAVSGTEAVSKLQTYEHEKPTLMLKSEVNKATSMHTVLMLTCSVLN